MQSKLKMKGISLNFKSDQIHFSIFVMASSEKLILFGRIHIKSPNA